jgi:16S rRNA (uracil1498-N3)-methyltransferase
VSRRRFFVDRFAGHHAIIAGDRAHHLRRVLRVEPGQAFELSDTRRIYLARITAATNSAITFDLEEEIPLPPPLPDLTLLAAIFKFDRFEWMLEKATELGATSIVPVVAARTDPGLARAAHKRVERWRRIVFEAAQQSRRLAPPDLADPQFLPDALTTTSSHPRWILDETLSSPNSLTSPAAVLLSGPEGGFTDDEREAAVRHDFQPISLGPLILRAETAPVAALAVLTWLHHCPLGTGH